MSSKLSAASQPRRSERKRTIKYHVVDLRLDRHALRYAKNWKQVKQYELVISLLKPAHSNTSKCI